MHNGARSKDAGRGERGAAARAAHRAAGEAGGGAGGGGPLVTVPGVQVRVPGSTSNVGAGFDCVGIAIERRLSATFRVDRALGAPVRVERRGTLQAVTVPSDRDWLFAGFVAACRGAGCKVPGGVMIDAASEIPIGDRKSTRLNSSHITISYAVFCLKKKKPTQILNHPPRHMCLPCHKPPIPPFQTCIHSNLAQTPPERSGESITNSKIIINVPIRNP